MDSRGTPPETSNFYCLPGRAGGTPIALDLEGLPLALFNNHEAPDLPTDGLGQALERIGVGEETLREALRLKPFEHWVGHIPFAFWIVSVLRPRTLVEIGVGALEI